MLFRAIARPDEPVERPPAGSDTAGRPTTCSRMTVPLPANRGKMPPMTARLAPALGLSVASVLLVAVGVAAMSHANTPSASRSTALAVQANTGPASSARITGAAPAEAATPSGSAGPAATAAFGTSGSMPPTPSHGTAPVGTASPRPTSPATASPTTASSRTVLPGTGSSTDGSPGAVASTAPRSPAQPGGGTTGSQEARAVFDAINRARLAQHLPALTWSWRLQLSAQRHNQAMASYNILARQVGNEGSLGQRESQAGVRWSFAAENIGWSTTRSLAGALGIQASMLAETAPDDAHRRNILSRDVQALGVAVLIDAEHGRLWLTEDFADVG